MATILIVEDQAELRMIHSTYLSHRGYRVVTTADGESAIEAARSYHPDFIVLDHSLPGRMGIDVAAEMRRDPELADVPIVMVTAHSYGAVGKRARAAGCNAFITKPCAPSRLLAEITRLTDTPAVA
jgi:two-component system, cell cycle response regulator DivK